MRLLVYGAGGPAGFNVCQAALAAGHEVAGTDSNHLHLPFVRACSDEAYIIPAVGEPGFAEEFASIHRPHDVIISQPEQGVRWLSENRPGLNILLPDDDVLRVCSDKRETALAWHQARLRRFAPVKVEDPYVDYLCLAADTFGTPFWLRATTGAGARGATLVDDLRTGHHWLRYWATRGFEGEWQAEEYLPGRDYCWTGIYAGGKLYAGFARERLEWIYPHLAPSGRTGTPTVAVTVDEPDVIEMAQRAVAAVDPKPNGVYCVDLREDASGTPRPTEINAGRFATTSPLYYKLGGANFVDLYVRLARGWTVPEYGPNCYPAGVTLSRHIDCGIHLS